MTIKYITSIEEEIILHNREIAQAELSLINEGTNKLKEGPLRWYKLILSQVSTKTLQFILRESDRTFCPTYYREIAQAELVERMLLGAVDDRD